MGISFKTSLRENQLASSVQSAEEKYHRETLKAAVDAETFARESVDAEIKADIAQLYNNLSDEIVLRAQDDLNIKNELQAAIDSETAIRSSQISTVQRNLDDESAARIAADNALKADYISADSALLDSINDNYTPKINSLTDALHNEETLSAQRDATLAGDLTASINAEKSARTTADTSLKSALDAETSTRKSQTDSLGAAVTKEISDRTNAVNNLQTNLSTAISNEATTRASAVTSLQSSITSAKTELNTAIANETAARNAAVTSLQSSISTAVANVQSSLKEYTPSTTTSNGTSGIMPAPPKLKSAEEVLVATHKGWQTLAEANVFIGAIPSQNGEPQYTGNAISPSWLNFEDQKMAIGGTTSATNAGTYTATFTPTGLYCWSDGTRTAKSVQWRIVPKVITIPTATTTEFTYSGSAFTLSVNNPNSDGTSQTGTLSATNAGSYTATYKLKSTTNYVFSDGTTTDKNIVWKINPKTVTIPTAAVTQFEYTGENITLSVTNPNADCINASGATWAVNAGSYTATYKLKSTTNYVFSDGTTTDKTINWKINAKKLAKPTASTTAFTYNKSAQGLTVSNYDANYMNKSGSDTATAAASYSVTYSLKNTTNTVWSDGTSANVVINWSIAVLKLAKPTASTTAFTYDGTSKNLTVSNFNSNYESLSGSTSEINAGSYSATYSLNDTTNTKWADNSTANVVINWSIARQKLTAAQSTFSQSGTLTYTGNSQSPTISGYNSTYHDLGSTTSATAAGSYTLTVTPKSNYAFSDGSTAAKSVSWSIGVLKFTKPTASTTEFIYSGSTFTLDVANYNSNYMTRTGTVSASAEGSYSVTYTLKDTNNYKWQDNTSTAVTINWKIKVNKFEKPTISAGASLEYTGGTLKPTIANYDSDKMTQSGSASAVNVGTYTITYSLKDKDNTTWSDGSTSDISLEWVITRKKLTAAQSTFSQSGTLTYTGSAQTVSISGYNASYHELSSTTSATNAGTYTAQVTPKSNYAFSDGSTAAKSVSWSIGAKALTKPTAAKTTFEYDGAEKTLSISNYNSSYMTKSGVDSASIKGSYTVTFTLNNTSNFKWADNSTAAHSIVWSIGAKSITKPTISGDTTFTYDGNAKTLNVTGYDSDTMTVSGTISATNAGDYTVTYTLRDKSNTCWASGDTNDVQFSWTINRAKLSAELSAPSRFSLAKDTYSINVAIKHWTYTLVGAGVTHYYDLVNNTENVQVNGFDSNYHAFANSSHRILIAPYYTIDATKVLGNRVVSIVPNNNYTWANGTRDPIDFNFTVLPMRLEKPTAATTSFLYDGETKAINSHGTYPEYFVVISGNESATSIGQYTATYSLNTQYMTSFTAGGKLTDVGSIVDLVEWSDGTTDDVTINWRIYKKLAKPTMPTTSYTYTGSTISPTVNNYDSTWIEKSGTDSAVNHNISGYTVTYALKDKTNTTWSDGTTSDISFSWSISKRTITKPTLTNTTFTYDGTAHSPTINNYDSTYVTQTGTASSTNAGNFTLTYALKNKTSTQWEGGGTDDISLSWVINKADPELDLVSSAGDSLDPLTFDATGVTKVIYANSKRGDGVTASSDDADIVVTTNGVNVRVTANDIGRATITVNLAETTNYLGATKTFTAIYVTEMNFANCTWAQIQKVAKSGLSSKVFESSVGTTKSISCSLDLSSVGKFNINTQKNTSFSSLLIRLMALRTDRIVCRIEPPSSDSSKAIVFLDDKSTSDTISTDGFCISNLDNVCQCIYNALPSDLKSVINTDSAHMTIIKFTDGTSTWAYSNPRSKLYFTSLFDIYNGNQLVSLFNTRTDLFLFSNVTYLSDYNQHEYYANGNWNPIYWQTNTGSHNVVNNWLLRDFSINERPLAIQSPTASPDSLKFVEKTDTASIDINPLFDIL